MQGYEGRRGERWLWIGKALGRSGWATVALLFAGLLVFGIAWRAHQRARFHELTTAVIPQTTSAPMPGGEDVVSLSRVALSGSQPEFMRLSVLPGVGMQVLQAVIELPEQNQVKLLHALSESDAALSPATVASAPFHLYVSRNHPSVAAPGEDLIGNRKASAVDNQTLIDGGKVSGRFQGEGPSEDVEATVEITLGSRQVDIVAQATSAARENRYVHFAWEPRFFVPDGDRNQLSLQVPSRANVLQGSAHAAQKSVDFSAPGGQLIGNQDASLRFSNLNHDVMNDEIAVVLRNGKKYSLRMTGVGPTIRNLRVDADAAAHDLVLGFSSLDPTADADHRGQVLRPGATVQWHLRMEVLGPETAAANTAQP